MSVPASNFDLRKLSRFNGPQYFLGGGFLAGLLVFLVWLAGVPDHGSHALRAQKNGEGVDGGLAAPGNGVLSGITGESASRASVSGVAENDFGLPGEGEFVDEAQQQADAEAEGGADADSMAIGEAVGAPEQAEGAALTDGLLGPAASPQADANAAPATAPGAPLLPYYVEVEVAPGQVQVLQLNAESPEHARAILRDFRGNPRVLRGPSIEPLP